MDHFARRVVFTTSPPCNEHEIFYLINVTKGHLEAVEGVSVKYDLSQPNTLSATRSEGECTAALFRNTQSAHLCNCSAQYKGYFYNTKCIFCAFNHCVENYLWFCNHPSCACVCVSRNLSFLSVFGQSMCIVLYCVLCAWSSIHSSVFNMVWHNRRHNV